MVDTVTTNVVSANDMQAAFERGRLAERVNEHDRRLDKINGSMDRVADELAQLRLSIQSIVDADIARDDRTVSTAKALSDASERLWTPWMRLGALAVAVSTIFAMGVSIFSLFGVIG